jgi:hypothetical protein
LTIRTAGTLAQRREYRLGDGDHPERVGLEDLAQDCQRWCLAVASRPRAAGDTGVVDEHIEAPVLGADRLGCLVYGRLIGQSSAMWSASMPLVPEPALGDGAPARRRRR